MPSDELEMINELLRSMTFGDLDLEAQRATVEASAGTLPPATHIATVDAGGVPCEWVTVGTGPTHATIVALRGGGYCLGSLNSNRRFCALLADIASARVLNVGYRSAPEHRFPAALEDALRAYRWAVGSGLDVGSLLIAGNSAGGGLALATLLALRDAGDPLPVGAIALSPWTDLAMTGASVTTNAATEVMLDPVGARDTALLYADATQLTDPYVSPLYGDPTGLPPLLLHVSSAEVLLDDALRFADHAGCAGVDVTLHVETGVPHVWHLFAGALPEADEAMLQVGLWVEELLQPPLGE